MKKKGQKFLFIFMVCFYGLFTSFSGWAQSGWVDTEVGASNPAGYFQEVANTVMVTAGSGKIYNQAEDNHYYLYKTVTGDCEITAHVQGFALTSTYLDEVGLLIREDLYNRAKQVHIVTRPTTLGCRSGSRVNTDGDSAYGVGKSGQINWLRLNRTGNLFTTYYSLDGVSWIVLSTDTIAMRPAVFIGLAACASAQDGTTSTVFDNIQVTGTPALSYSLNLTAGDGGDIKSDSGDIVLEGNPVTLTPDEYDGFVFDHWEGDVTGTANPLTFTMDGDKNIEAVFSEANETVLLLVDSRLYNHISTEIAQYVLDVESEFNVNLIVDSAKNGSGDSNQNMMAIRDHIKGYYENNNIAGAVMIGFFSIPEWTYYNDDANEWKHCRTTFLYQDLDAVFSVSDSAHYPAYDTWTRTNNDIEIWVSLMRPLQEPGSTYPHTGDYTAYEIEQMKDYLNKCSDYYNRRLVVPNRSLVYASQDYYCGIDPIAPHTKTLRRMYGSNAEFRGGDYGGGQEYFNLINNGYEIVNIWTHGSGNEHRIGVGPRSHAQSDSGLAKSKGQGGVINVLWNCHGADFPSTPDSNLALRYSLEGLGMLSMGVTRSDYTYAIDKFFNALEKGAYGGNAYKHTINTYMNEDDYSVSPQIITGNPFVRAGDNNMSAQPAVIYGTVQTPYATIANAKVTLYDGDKSAGVTFTNVNGIYLMEQVNPGTYILRVETPNGVVKNIDTPFTLSSGQYWGQHVSVSSSLDLVPRNSDWLYADVRGTVASVEAGWMNPSYIPDTQYWKTGQAPFAYMLEPGLLGTEVDIQDSFWGDKTTLYMRKDVNLTTSANSFLKVSADNDISVYVNGVKVIEPNPLADPTKVRPTLDYWNYEIEISSYLTTGDNLIAIKMLNVDGGKYLDALVFQK